MIRNVECLLKDIAARTFCTLVLVFITVSPFVFKRTRFILRNKFIIFGNSLILSIMDVDMMILALIFFVLLLLILTLIVFLWYSGLFINIDIKTCKPPFKVLEVAYKFARGSYRDCGALFTEAHSIAPKLRCIGIYYDCPTEVEDSSMRYIIGLIINDEAGIEEETRKTLQLKGFGFATFPEVDHIVFSSFPHRSVLSVIIAVNRVIPTFRDYIKEHKLQAYPLIEICDGQEIVYAAPLSKQDEFYVAEALAESEEEATSDQRNDDEGDESLKELDEMPDKETSDEPQLAGGSKVEELPNEQTLDSLEEKSKGMSNGSETSTESFEELQLDS